MHQPKMVRGSFLGGVDNSLDTAIQSYHAAQDAKLAVVLQASRVQSLADAVQGGIE